MLVWPVYSSKFKSGQLDSTYTKWVDKGITAVCTLTHGIELKSFDKVRRENNLDNSDLFRYFQLRHFYNSDIRTYLSQESSELIEMVTGAYRKLPSKIVSRLYKCLQNCNKLDSLYIK